MSGLDGVQRYVADDDHLVKVDARIDTTVSGESLVVLAVDAECAVTAAAANGYHDCFIEHYPPAIREQAIRDCIAEAERIHDLYVGEPTVQAPLWNAIQALRALLDCAS